MLINLRKDQSKRKFKRVLKQYIQNQSWINKSEEKKQDKSRGRDFKKLNWKERVKQREELSKLNHGCLI